MIIGQPLAAELICMPAALSIPLIKGCADPVLIQTGSQYDKLTPGLVVRQGHTLKNIFCQFSGLLMIVSLNGSIQNFGHQVDITNLNEYLGVKNAGHLEGIAILDGTLG